MIATLYIAPLVTFLWTLLFKSFAQTFVAVVCIGAIIAVAVQYYMHFEMIQYAFSHEMHTLFMFFDVAVLLYFLFQGIKQQHKATLLLALLQLGLYAIVVTMGSRLQTKGVDIIIDELSAVMFLIINVVGGLIIAFALEYMKHEICTQRQRSYFIALLFFFLFVMNCLVVSNSLELLFLCFELTTLCSYLLIRFRSDEVSMKNALRALWVNQLGGVAILYALIISVYYYNTIYFSELFERVEPALLLPIVLLVCAAYVKAASLPFQSWLLGAMVAPTPVSALLHSATMVKIAPFLILKIAVVFTHEVAICVALFGAIVFASAAFMALSKTIFKEILALSTIALLALIMALAALGTPEAKNAALLLMVFHSIAKALLFLQAGILEKMYGIKDIEVFDGLINYAPKVLFFILLGFASLTLPPFAAFMGKFIAIEELSRLIFANPIYLFVLIFILLGSAFLTVLYFKIASKLFTHAPFEKPQQKPLPFLYALPSWLLILMLVVSVGLIFELKSITHIQVWLPMILILMVPFLFYVFKFKKATYVKEYNCGEKDLFAVGCYSYALSQYALQTLYIVSSFLILVTLIFGVFA